MTDKPLPSLPETLELATGAALTSAGLVMASHLTPGTKDHALAFLAIYGTMMNTVLGRALRFTFTERIEPFMRGFTWRYGADPVEAHAKFEATAKANENNPTFNDAVYRSFRQMMDAADDSVMPALGSMGGLYSSQGKKADAFFRGFGRVLCDLEAGELQQLTKLLKEIDALNEQDQDFWLDVAIDWQEVDDKDEPFLWIVQTASSGHRAPGFEWMPRFFTLLKRESLARNKSSRYESKRNFESGDLAMYIEAAVIKQMLEILAPMSSGPTTSSSAESSGQA
ncbi:MAG TPA: hypothetical protein VFK05_08375 [Polyangiaceae bacterium]|nr:hypothetical protein [Polyangiaceae bacterium]